MMVCMTMACGFAQSKSTAEAVKDLKINYTVFNEVDKSAINAYGLTSIPYIILISPEGKILATGTPREIFAREEMMISAGLGVPEAAQLCRELRAKGFDLPEDLYRPDELKEHLLGLWRSAHPSEKEGPVC